VTTAILKNVNRNQFEQHPYHLVDASPWPLFTSFSILNCVLSFLLYFYYYQHGGVLLVTSLLILMTFMFRWFVDIIIESTYEGHHTLEVQEGIRIGMLLFIASEVMFFFSFFWAYFHCSLNPSLWIGNIWPPEPIKSLGIVDPWGWPLANTVILVSSGVTITWSHKALIGGLRNEVTLGLVWTLAYGLLFSFIQYFEYCHAKFNINDSVYGSLFYLMTGFHGAHVFVGSVFLIICLIRHILYHFTPKQHVGYECAIWYWHFVDVVWIFLYFVVYVWGTDSIPQLLKWLL